MSGGTRLHSNEVTEAVPDFSSSQATKGWRSACGHEKVFTYQDRGACTHSRVAACLLRDPGQKENERHRLLVVQGSYQSCQRSARLLIVLLRHHDPWILHIRYTTSTDPFSLPNLTPAICTAMTVMDLIVISTVEVMGVLAFKNWYWGMLSAGMKPIRCMPRSGL